MSGLFKLSTLIIVLCFSFLISSAQEDNLPPPDLPVIRADNVDRIYEIASIGNGGAGKLYWSPTGETLAVNNTYGIWLHDAHDWNAEPTFIPEPDLDALYFSDDGEYLIAWKANQNAPARIWSVRNGQRVEVWDEILISYDVNWRYQKTSKWMGPMIDRYQRTTVWDIVTDTALYFVDTTPESLFLGHQKSVGATGGNFSSYTFEVATGEPIHTFNEGTVYSQNVLRLMSPNGELVLLSSDNGLVLHSAINGEEIRRLETEGQWSSARFLMTPDSQHILAYFENNIYVWEVGTGNLTNVFSLVSRNLSPHLDRIFASDNQTLLTASFSLGEIYLYDLVTGLVEQSINVNQSLYDVQISENDCCIASITTNGVLKVHDTTSGEEIYTTNRYRPVGEVMAISSDGQSLVTIETSLENRTSMLRVWDLASGEVVQEVAQRYSPYTHVEFTPEGKAFISSSEGIYSLEIDNWLTPPFFSAWDVQYSPDGQYLVAVSGSETEFFRPEPPIYQTMTIYDAKSLNPLISIPESQANGGGFTAVAFSPDGKYIAADPGYYAAVWELEQLINGNLSPLVYIDPEYYVSDLAFSPDGKTIVAGQARIRSSSDGFESWPGPCSIVLWQLEDILDQTQLSEDIIRPTGCYALDYPVKHVRYSPHGDMLLAYGSGEGWNISDLPMTLVDAETGEILRTFHDQNSFIMSSEGTFIISEGRDQRLHYWVIP